MGYTNIPTYTWKEAVSTTSDLPTVGNSTGDARVVLSDTSIYIWTGSAWQDSATASTVTGPGSSTDNAIVRWNGTGGTSIQNSGITINDTNNILWVTHGGGNIGASAANSPDIIYVKTGVESEDYLSSFFTTEAGSGFSPDGNAFLALGGCLRIRGSAVAGFTDGSASAAILDWESVSEEARLIATTDGVAMGTSAKLSFWTGTELGSSKRLLIDQNGVISVIGASGANLLWNTDGGGNIGALGATRPNRIYAKDNILVGTGSALVESTGTITAGNASVSSFLGSDSTNKAYYFFRGAGGVYGFSQNTAETLGLLHLVDTSGNNKFTYDTNNGFFRLDASSGANILWNTDGGGNIGGGVNTNSPNNIWVKNSISVGTIDSSGSAGFIHLNNGVAGTNTGISIGSNAANEALIGFTNSGGISAFRHGRSDTIGLIYLATNTASWVNYFKFDARTSGGGALTLMRPSGANILWDTDGSGNIGASGANRPANVYIQNSLTIAALSGVLKASSGLVSGSATTTDLPEGTNLYYTQARFDSAFSAKSTTDLVEGSNLYYTDERAQDAIGTILVDSATIDFTYNDATPSITASVIQSGIDHGSIGGLTDDDHTQYALLAGRSGGQTLKGGTASGDNLTLESTSNATKGNIDIASGSKFSIALTNYEVSQASVSTVNATQTTLQTISTTTDTAMFLEARVVAKRTGGTAGSAGDGAYYWRRARVKNTGGTVTLHNQISEESEDQAGWDFVFDVSGTDIRLRVTGALDNNIDWKTTTITQTV